MSYKVNKREDSFLEILGSEVINLQTLQSICSSGIVDTCGIRPVCWRLLLFSLPLKRTEWRSHLLRQREDYKQFLNEIIIDPSIKRSEKADEAIDEDHPLNPNPTSKWNSYFKDNEILLQIDKDVRRLYPDISFFQNATTYPCVEMVQPGSKVETLRKRVERGMLTAHNMTRHRLGISNLSNSRKKHQQEYKILSEGQEAHWEVVERILFIYAKLNPGTSYVQGMNEIVGPLYYTLVADPNPEWKEHAEADTFFCFTNLMAEIRDNFIKSLDCSGSGIEASMKRVMDHLKEEDLQVFTRLQLQNIKPVFFLFRWITLLLSQEFPLPEVIYLWDILFSDKRRFDLLYSMCTAMIILLRDRLLVGDFSHNVKLLQNYPEDIQTRSIAQKAYAVIHTLPRSRP